MKKISKLINEIRSHLTDDLLQKRYIDSRHIKLSNTTGHCYIATEALYHSLTTRQQEIFKPCHLKINNITHWFLRKIEIVGDNVEFTILDPTSDQFSGQLPYELGINCGFLTKTPSKRTITLLERIKNGNRKRTQNIR